MLGKAVPSAPNPMEGGLGGQPYAVKSAEAVAAVEASWQSLACQTAPLCPINVPILKGPLSHAMVSPDSVYLPVASLAVTEHGISIWETRQHGFEPKPVRTTTYPCRPRSCSSSRPWSGARSRGGGRAGSGRGRSAARTAGGLPKPCLWASPGRYVSTRRRYERQAGLVRRCLRQGRSAGRGGGQGEVEERRRRCARLISTGYDKSCNFRRVDAGSKAA